MFSLSVYASPLRPVPAETSSPSRHSTQRGHKALGRHSFVDYKAASSTGIQKLQFGQLYSETH